MTTADPSRDVLAARNAALRDRVDTMIENFQQRTGQLARAQAEAVGVVGRARSGDGVVTVRSNAAGVPVSIELADDAFSRGTPSALAALVLRTTQEAARDARTQAQELLGGFTTAGSFLGDGVDPEEIVPGLHVVRPTIPEADVDAAAAADGDDWDPGASVLERNR